MKFKFLAFGARFLFGLALTVLTVLAPSGLKAQTDTLRITLNQVLEHALSSSPQVLAARKGEEQAGGMELSSLAGFLPHLKVSEVFSRGDDPVFAFATRLRQTRFSAADFDVAKLNSPGDITDYATRVVIEQPIFNAGLSYYGRKQAVAYHDAAGQVSDAVREGTRFNVRLVYYSLILARENLKVLEAALASARSHQHQARQMLETGLVTRADELKASVRVSELEQQRIRALNMVAVLSEKLKLASGWRDENFLMPSEELNEPDFTVALDSLTAYALAHQGELGAAKSVARAAEYGARAAWGEVVPRLNGFFQYERDGRSAFSNDGNNWMVGVALDWYPFDGFGSAGKIISKKAEREKAGYEAALAGHKVEVEVKESYLEAGASRKMIGVAREAERQAAESLRILENQYQAGLATITDLLDTELASTNSSLGVIQALYEYNVALARLAQVTGGYPALN